MLVVLFAFGAVGCKAGDVTVSFDAQPPWAITENGLPLYEKTVYSVQRLYVGSKEDVVIAEGTYESELIMGGEETTVTNKFSLTYNDDPHASYANETGALLCNAGLTDAYQSEVRFKNESLTPVYAQKTQSVAQRPLCNDADGNPYLPQATLSDDESVVCRYVLPAQQRYADPRGYSYTADYVAGKAAFSTTVASTTQNKSDNTYIRDYRVENKEYEIAGNTRYDNEQLAYVVRAMTGCKKGGSGTFYLTNFYDSYVKNKYVRYTMSLSCGSKNASVSLNLDPAAIRIADAEGELLHEDGVYTVDCVQASVSISSSTPGPSVSLLYTDPSYKIAQRNTVTAERSDGIATTKVLVQMTFTEYSYSSAKVNYRTVYTLQSFANRP